MNTPTVRIGLVGPANSGKTTVLNQLQKVLHSTPDRTVVFIPEAATYILQHTKLHPKDDPLRFQAAVSLLQHQQEESVDTLAAPLLQITDRCIADAWAYVSEEEAEGILHCHLEDTLKRYTAIIYCEPRPISDCELIRAGNEYRYESSLEELAEQDRRLRKVYSQHPACYYVPFLEDQLAEKTTYILDIIHRIITKQ